MYEKTPSLANSLRRGDTPHADPLVGLLDDATYDARRNVREQTKWDRSIDTESATWAGLLIDLAENGRRVTLQLETGLTVSGQITTVGADCVCIETPKGEMAILCSAIARIECETPNGPPDSERIGSSETFHSLLQRAAEDRLDVAFTLRGAANDLFGQLRTCGADVCALASEEMPRRYVYVRTLAVVGFRTAKP
jgi:hypothetical protein